jgi:hypothetical protein
MTATGVIILVHGSRGAQAAKDLPDNFDRIIRVASLLNTLPVSNEEKQINALLFFFISASPSKRFDNISAKSIPPCF